MHTVAVYTSINQRMLLIEMQRGEERLKPGTRGQKAPCSSFVLSFGLRENQDVINVDNNKLPDIRVQNRKEEETSSPARHYTSVPICRIRQPL
jgi:hypothetical protein